MLKTTTLPAKKKLGSNKFVLGFVALAATAIVGITGVAAAQTPGYGYGGSSSSNSINLNVNGSNNVIQIILHIFK